MILDIPYYSQKVDVLDKFWQKRSCGIVCVKMILDFFQKNELSLDSLIEEGKSMNGYDKDYGWKHNSLTNLLRNHNLSCYRQEFKKHTFNVKDKNFTKNVNIDSFIDIAIDKFEKTLLNQNPIIISISKGFSEENKFHMVVLTGLDLEEGIIRGFYYNDPDSLTENEGKDLFVPMHIFRKHWRKMAIFVEG